MNNGNFTCVPDEIYIYLSCIRSSCIQPISPVYPFRLYKMAPTATFSALLISTSFGLLVFFLVKVVNWYFRIRAFRKTMPAVAALFPPDSLYRQLWPKNWQSFHKDWHMQFQRSVYQKLNSDIFVLVCLFEYDKVFVSDPAAVLELKITKPKEFPRDMQIFRRVYSIQCNKLNLVCCIWQKCSCNYWGRMETSQEDHSTHFFPQKYATCAR